MNYTEEREQVLKEHAQKIKKLYEKYKGIHPQGQLDGEPWANEERVLKNELIEKLKMIEIKHNK